MSSDKHDFRASMGALSLGGLIGLFLSGIVTMQVYLYIRVYARDPIKIKAMVSSIWLLDFLHSAMVTTAVWMNVVAHFPAQTFDMDHIPWSVSTSVALTAFVIYLAHCFFIHRIYIVSGGNRYLAFPLAVIALFRLAVALVCTAKMFALASYSGFVEHCSYLFTINLCSGLTLDVVIATSMCYYLRRKKSELSTMNAVIDTLVRYTVETGVITCATTLASLACWLSMPHNLVFLGLHFSISKLYANSFMAILNSRVTLAAARSPLSPNFDRNKPPPMPLSIFAHRPSASTGRATTSLGNKVVEISVHKTVERDVSEAELGDEFPGSVEQLDEREDKAVFDVSAREDLGKALI